MNPLVRRTLHKQTLQQPDEQLRVRTHRIKQITVESQLSVGIEPRLSMTWQVKPNYWKAGYALLVFESTSGFAPEQCPADLNKHGSLIIETRDDSYLEQVPTEGTHYYTFVLFKAIFFGLFERMKVLRFSETVPSAKVALGRVRDQAELKGVFRQEEVGAIEHDAKVAEAELHRIQSKRNLEKIQNPPAPKEQPPAKKSVVGKKLDEIDAKLAAVSAAEAKLKQIKKDPKYKSLSRPARKAFLEGILKDLDPGELSAQSEMEDEE